MEKTVSFKISKLLKEKGFDKQTYWYFIYKRKFPTSKDTYYPEQTSKPKNWNDYNNLSYYEIFSAPTIAEVIMWLYEKYEIWISSIPRLSSWIFEIQEIKTGNNSSLINIDFYGSNTYLKSKGVPTIMQSPTEAYEAAIEYTLNNLI